MTKKETVKQNIGLTFEFIRYLIKNSKEIEKIPNNAEIEFLENGSPTVENVIKISHRKKKYYEINKVFQPIV